MSTYIQFIYDVFNVCEEGLYSMAAYLGMSYEELNILIFLVAEPIVFVVLLIRIKQLKRHLRSLTLITNRDKAAY